MLSLNLTAFQYPRLISTVDDVTLAAEVPRRTHTKTMRCNRYWLGTCAHCAHTCVLQETETSPKRRNSVRKRSFRGIRLHKLWRKGRASDYFNWRKSIPHVAVLAGVSRCL